MADKWEVELNAIAALKDEVKIMIRTVAHASNVSQDIWLKSRSLQRALDALEKAEKEANGE